MYILPNILISGPNFDLISGPNQKNEDFLLHFWTLQAFSRIFSLFRYLRTLQDGVEKFGNPLEKFHKHMHATEECMH